MNTALFPMFNKTVTVLHKSKGKYHGLDIWSKKEYANCFWAKKTVREISGQTASIGQIFVCRIPEQSSFPVAVGDYVVLGKVIEESITPDNIFDVIERYKPNVMTAKAVKDNVNLIDESNLVSPAIQNATHHYVEGV